MKPENAIEVSNITKKFKVYLDKGKTLKELTLFSKRRRYEGREVLKGISFEVKRGEAIGLVGHNGCGKSTTLKLLTKIMYPDSGTIKMKGRVSSLIELGAGFHPDMSGRENIYTNAAIFGLSRKEIDFRIDDIVGFSELEEFIDNPVRTYSSGMYMRLAFAVAINVDADILLIDEILAVGDANFQAKCFNKIREIKSNGTTIVIVSHALGQIEQICERSLWIDDGLIRAEGTPREVHPQYLDYMGQRRQNTIEKEKNQNKSDTTVAEKAVDQGGPKKKERWGNGDARITKISTCDSTGTDRTAFKTGDTISLKVEYVIDKMVKDAVLGIGIFRVDGMQCYGTNTRIDGFERFELKKDGSFEVFLEHIMLLPGEYNLDFAIESGDGLPIDYFTKAKKIEIFSELADVGIARIKHQWKIALEEM